MNKFDTKTDKIFVILDYIILGLFALSTIYPFWDMIIVSVSPKSEVFKQGIRLFTMNPTIYAYKQVFHSFELWQAFYNTLFRVIAGTSISILLTALVSYPLSKDSFPFRRVLTIIMVFTLVFRPGLIPNYLLIKNLNLVNTWWALLLPPAVTAYNIIIMRNFFRSIPDEMEESAKMDGASDFRVWLTIVLPLSKSVLATVSLWVAVQHWKAYFDALIYITDRDKTVLQVILRRILIENREDMFEPGLFDFNERPTEENIKAATIIISTVPIIVVYPFIQKYFVKGIMLGSIKG